MDKAGTKCLLCECWEKINKKKSSKDVTKLLHSACALQRAVMSVSSETEAYELCI